MPQDLKLYNDHETTQADQKDVDKEGTIGADNDAYNDG